MGTLKLAFRLFKNNLKLYSFYLLVIVISVFFYYNFAGIKYNAAILRVANVILYAKIASNLCSIVLITSIIFFIWHSNKFFLKHRQKETGLYLLMGVSSSKIGKVFALESILFGLLGLVVGLPLGMLSSKSFFSLLAEVLLLNNNLKFSIPPKAIMETVILFSVVLVVTFSINYYTVRKSRLLDLFHAAKKEEGMDRYAVLKGLFGVLLIAACYIVTLNLWNWKIDFVMFVPLIAILASVGTYILFGSSLSFLFTRLIRCKGLIYRGTRLLSLSNVIFRLKTNSRNLANIAILAAAMLTSLNLAISLYVYADNNFSVEVPYSISYTSQDRNMREEVTNLVGGSGFEIKYSNTIPFLIAGEKNNDINNNNNYIVIGFSDFQRSVRLLDIKHAEDIIEKSRLDDKQITVILPAKVMGSTVSDTGSNITVGQSVFQCGEMLRIPLMGNSAQVNRKYVLVVSDRTYSSLSGSGKEYYLHGITIANQQNSRNLVMSLKKVSPELGALSSYIDSYGSKYYVVGVFYFLGVMMSIIFMLAIFSMIYFKTLFDGLADKEQYVKVIKIGISKRDVKKSIAVQTGISFLLPMLVGIAHSIVAIRPIEHMLYTNLAVTTGCSTLVFIGVMGVFYLFLNKKYFSIVYGVRTYAK